MKKLILASASPQRKKLLKFLGLNFIVRPSRAHELTRIKSTCARLVMKNALLKAKDVASQVKSGIVIGADTLVYDGHGKIIGKPRNLKIARDVLKSMARRPHWVYTGLAVMDAETKKHIVDFEKTKVFMEKLSDHEIARYHNHTSPLDKAGGFDIEGKGGLFIRRIEGCYYNVIGLPLAKLCAVLKKFGVQVLMLLLMVWVIGCSTEYNLATGREESLMYSTEKEVKIGDAVAASIEQQYEINHDVDVNERVENIVKRIVAVCDRQDIVYSAKVINDDLVNAVSLPGGYVYVFKGLLDKVKSDDQLASVIAHEIGHITARHGIKRLQAQYGYMFLQVLSAHSGDADFARGVQAAALSVFLEYSQADEFEADRLAVKYIKKAGYAPEEVSGMLRILREQQDKEPLQPASYWRTHPYINQRIANVNKEISGQLHFKDYLNLTGER